MAIRAPDGAKKTTASGIVYVMKLWIQVSKAEEEQMGRNFGTKRGCENTAVLHSFLLQVSNLLCMNVWLFVHPENSEEHFYEPTF